MSRKGLVSLFADNNIILADARPDHTVAPYVQCEVGLAGQAVRYVDITDDILLGKQRNAGPDVSEEGNSISGVRAVRFFYGVDYSQALFRGERLAGAVISGYSSSSTLSKSILGA